MAVEKWASCLVAAAGLAGAAGVAEAAYAAHQSSEPLLQVSSHFLLLHAAAVIAIAAFACSFPQKPRLMLSAASLLLFGCILFCGDLSVRAFAGSRLFPMAAPLGGSSLIIGWLATAVAALLLLRKPAS
ncbi:DUF423 domain-containing protein [Methyloferula stellata]|uniref:DUF423 domain-containing protein n=1 Tax=Methyloferula stellata TaxID=876270 RepID=UPI00037FFB9B|nr:DUF423 domain-containing protein [Methyloferula stellata]